MGDSEPAEFITVGRYLAYDEGCYECGEPSGVIGFFGTMVAAHAAVRLAEENQERDWRGQHLMHVIDLKNPAMSEHRGEQ